MPLSPDNAARMLGEVRELFEDAAGAFRNKRLDRVAECAALYRGWALSLRGGGNYTSPTDPQGEAVEHIPIARFLVRAAVAHTLKQNVGIECPAAKGDAAARSRAKNTERFAQSLLRTKLKQDELRRAVSWSKQGGAAWLKVFWDANAGKIAATSEDGFTDKEFEGLDDPMSDEKVRPVIFTGDIGCRFVPTTDGFPDPSARSKAEVGHFFEVKMFPIWKAEDMFPTDAFGEPTTGRFDVGLTEEQATLGALGDDESFFARRDNRNMLCSIVEFWELPTRRYPRGRFIAYSGPTILAIGPNPYFPARIPYILIPGDNLVPASLYPDGLLEDVRGLQYSANRSQSKMREWLDKTLNAYLFVPKQSGIDSDIWGDKPGQIIPYNKGYKPEPYVPPNIPSSMFDFLDQNVERAKALTGYTDIGRGELSSDISGRAVAFATENEQGMREPDMASFREAMVEVAQHMVYLARQFFDNGRMVQILGETGQVEMQEFLSDEYDWDTDLVPEIYSGRPQSHAARISEVLEFSDAGLFAEGPEAERARRMLGNDYSAMSTYDPFDEDRARARRENLAVLKDPMGTPISVMTFDTHKIHLEEHYRWMRTPEFEALPDWQRELALTHCDLHEYLAYAAGLVSDELVNGQGEQQQQNGASPSPPGANQGQPPPPGNSPPGPPPSSPGNESPPSGGQERLPAPAPTIDEFAQMSPSEQAAADQS